MRHRPASPPDTAHRCQCRVLYGDTDSGGVVYYANYLRYFEQGRTELMRAAGYSYRELEAQGLIMPVVESYVRYKAAARYDDLLTIRTALTELKTHSCRFDYEIIREPDQLLLVKGFTVNAVVNREGRLSKFPGPVFSLLDKISRQLLG
ncbi:MAG: thioesterase family protein [Desulfobacteraceae bacterium]|nr:thioesterase family protein [Desulfobacteraceae bacterium]